MRMIAAAVVALVANAVGLVVTAQILDGMSLHPLGFVIAAAIFTGVMVLTSPLLRQVAVKQAPAMLGGTALIATLVSLIVTSLVAGDNLRIRGMGTWLSATVLVWAIALVARLLLPLVIFKKVLGRTSE